MTEKTTDQVLLEAIQEVRADVARVDRDLGNDRDSIENMAVATAANTEQVKQFGKRLETIEKRIQEKMADVIAPMMEQTQDLKETIDKKRTMVIAEKPVSFFKHLWRWWKAGW